MYPSHSSQTVAVPAAPSAAFEQLKDADNRLRELSARINGKLTHILRPANVQAACSAPLTIHAGVCFADVTGLIRELNVTMDVISDTLDRIDL